MPFFLVTLLAFAVLFLVPEAAHAEYKINPDCSKYLGLTNHIAGCIRETLKESSDAYFDGMYPIFEKAISATMILAVSIFGAMAAFGVLEKPGRDVLMLVIKIAFVSWFCTNSQDLYNLSMITMDSTAQAVVSYIPTEGKSDNSEKGDFSQIACMKNMSVVQGDPEEYYIWTLNEWYDSDMVTGPWLAMDCIIDTVIGIHVATKDPDDGIKKSYNEVFNPADKGPSRGLIYLFFSSMQSSVMGLILGVVGLIFIWGLLNLIIKALFIYLAGYIGLAVMMIFGPLFIPMVLFQSTKNYFDRWIKLIISFTLQPVIILVFVAFSISAVDLAVFSGDYSVMYRIAGDASREKNFSLNNYLSCVRSPSDPTKCIAATTPPTAPPADAYTIIEDTTATYGKVKTDMVNGKPTIQKGAVESVVIGLDESKCIDKYTKILDTDSAAVKADKQALQNSCNQSYPLQIFRKNIKWDKLAKARVPAVVYEGGGTPTDDQLGQQISSEVMASVIFAAVVVFVMNGLLRVIPLVSYDLIGDFSQSPNLASAVGGTPGGKTLRSTMGEMVSTRRGIGS